MDFLKDFINLTIFRKFSRNPHFLENSQVRIFCYNSNITKLLLNYRGRRLKKILNCQFKRSCFISFWSSHIFIFSNKAKLFLARTDLRSELESLFYEIHLLEKTDQSRSQDLTKLKDILLHCKDEVSLFSFRPHFHPYLPPFSPLFTLLHPHLQRFLPALYPIS